MYLSLMMSSSLLERNQLKKNSTISLIFSTNQESRLYFREIVHQENSLSSSHVFRVDLSGESLSISESLIMRLALLSFRKNPEHENLFSIKKSQNLSQKMSRQMSVNSNESSIRSLLNTTSRILLQLSKT